MTACLILLATSIQYNKEVWIFLSGTILWGQLHKMAAIVEFDTIHHNLVRRINPNLSVCSVIDPGISVVLYMDRTEKNWSWQKSV